MAVVVTPAVILAPAAVTLPTLGDTEWQVDIVARNEIRFTMDSKTYTQKKIALEIPETSELQVPGTFDEFWTREIATFLGNVSYLQAQFPIETENLRWVLYHPKYIPAHKQVAAALLRLMEVWMRSCDEDKHCIAPPSSAMMQEPEFQKIMMKLSEQGIGSRE